MTVRRTTGRWSAPTPGRGAPGIGFTSVASSFGRLERMDSSPPRRATSIVPIINVSWGAVRSSHDRKPLPSHRLIAVNALIDGVAISPAGVRGRETVQHCGLGVFEAGQA